MNNVDLAKLNEADAHQIEQRTGYVVIEIEPHGRARDGSDLAAAEARACELARQSPGKTFGVFKLARDYTAVPGA